MIETWSYFLDVHKKDRDKVLEVFEKVPSSRFAIVNEKTVNYAHRFTVAITQADLLFVDAYLKKLDVNHKFTLIGRK